jgi:hypothetical protein
MIGSNAVFEVPDIGAGVYQMGQQKKAEQEKVKRERESQVSAYDAEKLYYSTDMSKINPNARPIVKDAFSIWKENAVNYKMTGSEADKTKMLESYQQLNNILGAEKAISENAFNIAKKYQETGGAGIADTKEEFDSKMNAFSNPSIPHELKDGRILIGGVDFTEHPRYSVEPNDFNRPAVNVIDPRSRFLDIDKIANDQYLSFRGSEGVLTRTEKGDFYNTDAFLKKIDSSLDAKLLQRDALESVYISHAMIDKGKNPNTMDRAELDAIIKEYDADPAQADAAIKAYKDRVKSKAKDMINADKPKPEAKSRQSKMEKAWGDTDGIIKNKLKPVTATLKGEKNTIGYNLELNTKELALPLYDSDDAYLVTRVNLDESGNVVSFEGKLKPGTMSFDEMIDESFSTGGKKYYSQSVRDELQSILDSRGITNRIKANSLRKSLLEE